MVRNSCGSNAYVSDEIITSRAGVRLRVVNTDAEGRMAMVDVLAHMKEKALNEVKKSFIMSGSCHLDRASNVEIGVECQMFVIAIFFNYRRVLQFVAHSRYYKGALAQKR